MGNIHVPQVHREDMSKRDMSKHDVSSEEWREYDFVVAVDDGEGGFTLAVRTYRINKPVTLYVKRKPYGDTHRVVDAAGVTHYIPMDWVQLRWKANPEVEF